MKEHFYNKSRGRLRIERLNGHSVHIVEAENPRSLALLAEAYKTVYEPAFPLPEEKETLEAFLASLHGANPHVDIIVTIVGDKLDTKEPVIKGVSVGYYYNQEDVALLAYNATSPAFRNQGLGNVMVEARKKAFLEMAQKNGGKLQGVFLECIDPQKAKPEEVDFDPVLRLKIFQKWGARVIPVDYSQPPLAKGADKCDALQLLAYPHPETGEHPTPEGIRAFVRAIYTELAKRNGSIPAEDPDYLHIMRQIDAMKATNDNRPYKKPSRGFPPAF